MARNRAASQQRRQTDAYRMNRKLYLQQPEVRQKRAIKRAIKHHLAPPTNVYGVMKPPGATG